MTRFRKSLVVLFILCLGVAAPLCVGPPYRPLRARALPLSPDLHQATGTLPHPQTSAPTVTPTLAPGDIVVTGYVYDARLGPSRGIAGAIVSVLLSVPRRFSAPQTGPDGYYRLFVPSMYAELIIQLDVWATCYESFSQPMTPEAMRAQPTRDFALDVSGECSLFLPIAMRGRTVLP